jgi:hypothetical protein
MIIILAAKRKKMNAIIPKGPSEIPFEAAN